MNAATKEAKRSRFSQHMDSVTESGSIVFSLNYGSHFPAALHA